MKLKNMWFIFIAVLLVTLSMRIYQVLYLIDPVTGFYMNGETISNMLSIIVAVSVVVLIVISFRNFENNKHYRAVKSTSLAVIGTITGLGMVLLNAIPFIMPSETQKSLIVLIFQVLGICSGFVFIIAAYCFAVGNNIFEKYELLALIPSLWGCSCLVKFFIECVASVNIAENVYSTITASFLLLFLFRQAKILAGINDDKNGKMLYVFGFPAALMLLITGIPGTILLLLNINQAGVFPRELYPVNIFMALYIIAFLVKYSDMPQIIIDKTINSTGVNSSSLRL